MLSRRLIVSACLFCLLAPAPVLAQGQAKPVRDFNTADINKDGKVTLDELVAHTGIHPDKAKKITQKYSRDGKDFLLPQEFDAWKAEEGFDDQKF